jgi:hypothetical protein
MGLATILTGKKMREGGLDKVPAGVLEFRIETEKLHIFEGFALYKGVGWKGN